MYTHTRSQGKQRREPTERELFTGGKDAEFAIFFNTAHTKLLRTINYWQTGQIEFDEGKLDKTFNPYLDRFENNQPGADFSDEIYAKLRNYIWKGYLHERNSAGYELNRRDKTLIRHLICKLRALRNFHSHAYHDNADLTFSEELRLFVEDLHADAMHEFSQKYPPEEIGFYQENLAKHPLFKQGRITQEGRTFFLCLFLTSGEVSRLLQQRRGSKKNDELRFRIKHYIYRYYAHRDGAARKYYNLEEDLHDTLPEEELRGLLDAQKFYKLNTQVNDVPEFLHRRDLFPLFLKNAADGTFAPCETVQDLAEYCRQNRLGESLRIHSVYKKDSEEEKAGVVRLSLADDNSAEFQLKKGDYHGLILDLIRLGEAEVLQRLRDFLDERKTIVHALAQPAPEEHLGTNGDTPITLADYEKYKLRGDRRLKETFVQWLMAYENGHRKQAEMLRDLREKLETAPIELRHFDLYREADQKPRMSDRFIEWCVEFLIDFGITPNWYWAFESFQTVHKTDAKTGKPKQVLKKVLEFHRTKPAEGNFRLCVDSGHILVKLSADKAERPFSLGAGALRNLMTLLLDRRLDKPDSAYVLQNLLTDLRDDLNAIERAIAAKTPPDWNALRILDRASLPEALLLSLGDTGSRADWRQKTRSRLAHIVQTLEGLQQDKTGLSRADKNEQVMRCYQFFDWDPKFLRRNEYQQLSIFHYSLERITALEQDLNHPKYKRDAERNLRYYDSILKEIKSENPKARIPEAVDAVLQKATSLDDLLDRAIAVTLETLRRWQKTMENGSAQQQQDIAQRLKIRQTGTGRAAAAYPAHIPFSVHPVLVLKRFYKKDAEAEGGRGIPGFSLSKKVRDNAALTRALRRSNYDCTGYFALLDALPEQQSRTTRKKIIGARNEAVACDAILWYVASRYFERISPNVRMTLSGHDAKGKARPVLPAEAGNLRRSTLAIRVATPSGRTVDVELFFHQLDDTLFVESKTTLTNVVDYLYRRRAEEPERYREVTDDRLTYGEITKEMARLQNDAIVVARHLLAWEQSVVAGLSDAQLEPLLTAGRRGKFLNFAAVCAGAALPEEQAKALAELRNHLFHAKIPLAFTYRSHVQTPAIEALLGKIEFKKDVSKWVQ